MANDLKKNPIRKEEINILLAIFLPMGILGCPTKIQGLIGVHGGLLTTISSRL
jgi:hypothetical protein